MIIVAAAPAAAAAPAGAGGHDSGRRGTCCCGGGSGPEDQCHGRRWRTVIMLLFLSSMLGFIISLAATNGKEQMDGASYFGFFIVSFIFLVEIHAQKDDDVLTGICRAFQPGLLFGFLMHWFIIQSVDPETMAFFVLYNNPADMQQIQPAQLALAPVMYDTLAYIIAFIVICLFFSIILAMYKEREMMTETGKYRKRDDSSMPLFWYMLSSILVGTLGVWYIILGTQLYQFKPSAFLPGIVEHTYLVMLGFFTLILCTTLLLCSLLRLCCGITIDAPSVHHHSNSYQEIGK
jgi:hypothetical protein